MTSKKIVTTIPPSMRVLRKLSTDFLGECVSMHQLRVLKMVSEGFSQSEIASMVYVTNAAISKVIQSLVEKNLILRCEGKDRRSQGLVLTSEGKKILNRVSHHVEKKLNTALNELSPQERKDLDKGLDALNKLMELVNEA